MKKGKAKKFLEWFFELKLPLLLHNLPDLILKFQEWKER